MLVVFAVSERESKIQKRERPTICPRSTSLYKNGQEILDIRYETKKENDWNSYLEFLATEVASVPKLRFVNQLMFLQRVLQLERHPAILNFTHQ